MELEGAIALVVWPLASLAYTVYIYRMTAPKDVTTDDSEVINL